MLKFNSVFAFFKKNVSPCSGDCHQQPAADPIVAPEATVPEAPQAKPTDDSAVPVPPAAPQAEPSALPEAAPDPFEQARKVLEGEGYVIMRCIGEGGYGRVYFAKMPGSGLRALKIVPRLSENSDCFERELVALKRIGVNKIRCDHLVEIEDFEVHDSFLSYSMPLADDASGVPVAMDNYKSMTLGSRLEMYGRLPVDECVEVIRRVLSAVETLHFKGFIHRDIKPSNVIYIKGQPVLADIGLVTHEGRDISQISSPSNFPPEGVGQQTGDIYAAGLLLYRIATGRPAEECPAIPPCTYGARFSRLNHVILIACHEAPSRRYINAKAMRLALDWVVEQPSAVSPKTQSVPPDHGAPPSDSPEAKNFKTKLENRITCFLAEQTGDAEQTIHHRANAFREMADTVSFEFERRIGHVPATVEFVNKLACAMCETDILAKEDLFTEAAQIAVGMPESGHIINAIGTNMGWILKHTIKLALSLSSSQANLPPPLRPTDTKLLSKLVLNQLNCRNPETHLRQASGVLISGMRSAADSLWPSYYDQLSL